MKSVFKINDHFSFGFIERTNVPIHEKDIFNIKTQIIGMYWYTDVVKNKFIELINAYTVKGSWNENEFGMTSVLELEITKIKNKNKRYNKYSNDIHKEKENKKLKYFGYLKKW